MGHSLRVRFARARPSCGARTVVTGVVLITALLGTRSRAADVCSVEQKQGLEKLGYSSCEVADACGAPPVMFVSELVIDKQSTERLTRELNDAGCAKVQLLTLGRDGRHRLISRNCEVIDTGRACPPGFKLRPRKVAAAPGQALCMTDQPLDTTASAAPARPAR